MNNRLYTLYIVVLGIISFRTGEVVTFAMLALIFVSLTNIHATLKEILKVKKDKIDGESARGETFYE